jgi:hypothetical protein
MNSSWFDELLPIEYRALEDGILLDVGDVARILDVHRNIVRWFAEAGTLPHQRTRRGTFLFRQGDVMKFHDARGRARLVDHRKIRTPRHGSSYQLPLELLMRKPAPWTFAGFKPTMLRAGRAKQLQCDRTVNPGVMSKVRGRVA